MITVGEVTQEHGTSRKRPLPTTEHFIKFEQDWPVNKSKKVKDNKQLQAYKDLPAKEKQPDPRDNAQAEQDLAEISDRYDVCKFVRREELNDDVRIFTFEHGKSKMDMGVGQHAVCGFLTNGGVVERPYAITRPTGSDKDDGTFDIVCKVLFPSDDAPGGFVSGILDALNADRGDEMLVRGPEGPIVYDGNGHFTITHPKGKKKIHLTHVNFVSGGTGMVPIYTTIKHMIESDTLKEGVQIRFVDCNIDEGEILLKDKLDKWEADHGDTFRVLHILEKPSSKWKGETGLVDKDRLANFCTPPGKDVSVATFVCGPPPMVKATMEAAKSLGFEDHTNLFHY
ncbi:hypothetical protein PYCC9005_005771 [Savitreella phatthalungensis]